MQTKETIAKPTVGVDLGDRKCAICRVDADGEVVERRTMSTPREFVEPYFRTLPTARVVMEVGTHSSRVSRLLEELGHEVIVTTPSKIRAKSGRRKSDRIDAEWLARQRRADPKLRWPIEHRGKRARADLVLLDTRDCLVKRRTLLINPVHGSVKPMARRTPMCSAESFHRTAPGHIPEAPVEALNETMKREADAADELAQMRIAQESLASIMWSRSSRRRCAKVTFSWRSSEVMRCAYLPNDEDSGRGRAPKPDEAVTDSPASLQAIVRRLFGDGAQVKFR